MADDMDISEISKLKVPDLKKELKNRGLSTTGNKTDLVERLQRCLKATDIIDDIEEDLLNDDDDEHLSESGITDLDNELEDSPGSQKRKLQPDTETKPSSEPPKKVILNRATSLNIPKSKTAAVIQPTVKKQIEISKENKVTSEDEEEKKVVKLSELTVKERLELRAKKFGVAALNDDVKKLARAERFGAPEKKTQSNSIGKLSEATSIDILKKRAERFGGSVSSVMSTVENKEKLEKRKERFGTAVTVASKNGLSGDEAKKARLDRFKTSSV